MRITKLTSIEQLEKLKRNDRLIVHWNENSTATRKGEPITMTKIYGLYNNNKEVIVRKKDNLYFIIDMFLNDESVAKEAYLVTED